MNDSLASGELVASPESTPLETALKAAQEGASDAVEAARQFLPTAGRLLSRAGYNSGFAISYGVVFPAVLLARVFPSENPVAYGLADGARAGLDQARRSRECEYETGAPAPEAAPDPAPPPEPHP
jgi:hypothetical protein